jgi:hypothetical protein
MATHLWQHRAGNFMERVSCHRHKSDQQAISSCITTTSRVLLCGWVSEWVNVVVWVKVIVSVCVTRKLLVHYNHPLRLVVRNTGKLKAFLVGNCRILFLTHWTKTARRKPPTGQLKWFVYAFLFLFWSWAATEGWVGMDEVSSSDRRWCWNCHGNLNGKLMDILNFAKHES